MSLSDLTAAALDQYDLVLSHVEAPDEASHQADWKTKVAAIEHIDKHVVGPVVQKLKTYPEWRVLVMPDHPTNIATRKHGYAPTLFAMSGTRAVTIDASCPESSRSTQTLRSPSSFAGTMSCHQLTAACTQCVRSTPLAASNRAKCPSAGL